MSYKKEPDIGFVTLVFFAILIFLGIVVSMMSCSYEKKVAKTYQRGAQYSPITKKDTLNATKIALKVIKEKPPRIIPGKTVQVPVTKVIKDTIGIKHIKDSLSAFYKDKDSLSRDDYERQFNEAFNTAYDKGFYDAEQGCPHSVQCPPVICPEDTATQLQLEYAQAALALKEQELIKAVAQSDIYKGQNKTKGIFIWLLIAALAVSIFLNIKRIFQ